MARDMTMAGSPASRAVVAAHAGMMRRQFALLASGRVPVVRGLEMIWCFLEAVLAAQRGARLTQKDLYALCSGAMSMATLSRAVADGVKRGYLAQRPAPEDSRVKLIEPTARGLHDLEKDAPGALAALRATLSGA